jgi:hypothetical protein
VAENKEGGGMDFYMMVNAKEVYIEILIFRLGKELYVCDAA